jgi:anhydro-N-acetylmuramic acid kinase
VSGDADPRELFVGVMSGTSLDGLDVVLADFSGPDVDLPRLVAARTFDLHPSLHADLVRLCAPGEDHLDLLGHTGTRLGARIAEAVLDLLADAGVQPAEVRAIGSHGQTVRHRPGGETPFTLQIGNPDLIAERTGICVVADFRGRDLAAGGQGAPLVPAFHRALFAADVPRVVVNIGGMANLTLLPDPDPARVGGFDTGPGNVLIDAWARRHLQAAFDEDGLWACQGRIDPELLDGMLEEPYFHAPAPKSTGRERFDEHWLDARLTAIGATRAPAVVAATLTELTARTIARGITDTAAMRPRDVLVCGGGRRNGFLMERLQAALPDATVRSTDAVGVDGDWVEGLAFAWLARRRLLGLPGNVPAVTGAAGERVLGAVWPA